ncbi:hypothetical protein BAY61_31990 (plasmid) [Prauserella marina]|uniref:O-Methyltransferase involved in polyketide biosynthesis n=1 Tax=Prauserella marina TaxID=530584 RepID=A0A222W126_9PSEU|nr:SAM-dependent methyltransferase [Prauserella marina]ASR39906.1 hypothetical protein BAY61_31990 [Prauserella marina]PWV71405.1 O-methyltransferase involved in polyketide biosynthesis [Prauserella marina]SDD98386.1 O-Methyltransferase involved in polyketide biosynthesis [Prauserella marina]
MLCPACPDPPARTVSFTDDYVAVTTDGLLVRDPRTPDGEPIRLTDATLNTLRELTRLGQLDLPQARLSSLIGARLQRVDRALAAALEGNLDLEKAGYEALKILLEPMIPSLTTIISDGLAAHREHGSAALRAAYEQVRNIVDTVLVRSPTMNSSQRHDGVAPPAPIQVDADRANPARVYDYLLDGTLNNAVDREFAKKLPPEFRIGARMNREWLLLVVKQALDAGITQFLDLGSGLPTGTCVHDIVTNSGHDGRVLYVDYEPVARTHLQERIDKDMVDSWCGGVRADLRDPQFLFRIPEVRKIINWNEPVCVLMVAVLHFVGAETHIPTLLQHYRDRMAPGSWLAITHASLDDDPHREHEFRPGLTRYQASSNPVFERSRDEIESWFDGMHLIDPGVVHIADWPGIPPPRHSAQYAAWAGAASANKPNPGGPRPCPLTTPTTCSGRRAS